MTKPIALRPRLRAIADMIPRGTKTVLDIGTDHAQLPVFLVQQGIANLVIASDIAEGPLARAKETVERFGVEKRVTLHQGNGLEGLEECGASEIVIAGMGGELMMQMIGAAPFVRDSAIGLILQPMTRAEVLCAWLGEQGFAVEDEVLVEDDKLYRILAVRYHGRACAYRPIEAVVGPKIIGRQDDLTRQYLARLLAVYNNRVEGKARAGQNTKEDEEICRGLRQMLGEDAP